MIGKTEKNMGKEVKKQAGRILKRKTCDLNRQFSLVVI